MPRRTNTKTGRTGRDAGGRFTRTTETAEHDHRAAELHGQGWSYRRIAAELGFASGGHAHDAVSRAFAEIPTEGSEEARRLDLERIDRLIEWNMAVMLKEHVAVSNGRVVGKVTGVERDEDGAVVRGPDGKAVLVYEDVLDDGPGQASAREIRALLERRAKIFGYEAPVKHEHRTIGEIDARLIELADEVAAMEPADAAGVPRQA